MFSTINGTKFKCEKDDIENEIVKRTGADKDKIIIHNEFVGFFNCKETEGCDNNIFQEYGVPDKVYWSSKPANEFLDYKRGKITKNKKFKSFIDGCDPNRTAQIFKHLLCDDEEEEENKQKIHVELDKYIQLIESGKDLNDEDKQIVCDNMEEVLRQIFSRKN